MAAVAGFLAACSSGSDGPSLPDVAQRLRSLEGASVSLRFEAGDAGFTIEGAFSMAGDGPYPVARLTHQPLGDGQPTTVVLTGSDGFVEVEGTAYRLPPAQLDALRIPEDGAASALAEVRLEDWFADVSSEDGAWVGEGDPDVVVPDIVALASGLGAGEVVVADVDDALRVEAEAEGDDLRRLSVRSDALRFDLELDDHGEPVEVDPPEAARPYEELGR